MQLRSNIALKDFSTMRLGGPADFMLDINSPEALIEALQWAKQQSLPVIMIGGGSNIIWQDAGFAGLVLVNKIMGYNAEVISDDTIAVTVGAGEPWDGVVARAVSEGLSGIEALSLIPGTTGATPVQNVGAYGQEMSQVISQVHVIDSVTHQVVILTPQECDFAYRSSKFKHAQRGRYFITAITMHLHRAQPKPPFYPALQHYLDVHEIAEPTLLDVRNAVIAIRSAKLPDPALVANCGSFFANPIVNAAQLSAVEAASTTQALRWPTQDGQFKIPAAWLIEQVGFKDYHDPKTGMGTWPVQPLVLVNESSDSTEGLITFRDAIISAVQQKFGITLQQEPELLP